MARIHLIQPWFGCRLEVKEGAILLHFAVLAFDEKGLPALMPSASTLYLHVLRRFIAVDEGWKTFLHVEQLHQSGMVCMILGCLQSITIEALPVRSITGILNITSVWVCVSFTPSCQWNEGPLP